MDERALWKDEVAHLFIQRARWAPPNSSSLALKLTLEYAPLPLPKPFFTPSRRCPNRFSSPMPKTHTVPDERYHFRTNGTYSGRMGTVALPQPCSLTPDCYRDELTLYSRPCPCPHRFSRPCPCPHRPGRTVHIPDEWDCHPERREGSAMPNPSSLTLPLTLKSASEP
jgi:hypothetical protein